MIQAHEEGGLSHRALRYNHKLQSQKFAFSLEFYSINMKRIPLSPKRIQKIIKDVLHLQLITVQSMKMIKSCNI